MLRYRPTLVVLCIQMLNVETMSTAMLPPADEAPRTYPVARIARCACVGVMFGTFMGVMTPISPLFRRTFQEDKMGHRLVIHAATASLIASGWTYGRYIDWGTNDPSFFPWMTPFHAPLCGMASYLACSLTYPGIFVFMNEPTLKIALYEYVRLSLKMIVAFHKVHIPAVLGLSVFLGTILYPWNRRKRSWTPPPPRRSITVL
jgi:hypothetical protein